MTKLARSPWVVHFNCNSCNGCDIEFLACLTPCYDVERFGVLHVGNPKHADVLVVTGGVNHRNARVLQNVYTQIPDPKVVLAIGACAAGGGIFRACYNVLGGIEQVVPVDVVVPGCPPRPEAIIDGIAQAAMVLQRKLEGQPAPAAEQPTVTLAPAATAVPAPTDAPAAPEAPAPAAAPPAEAPAPALQEAASHG